MRMILDRLPPGLRVGTPVLISAAAVGISAIVVAISLGSVASTLTLPSIDESESDPVTMLATKSGEEIERSRKRFDNRSMYNLPSPPPRRTPVVKREEPKPPPVVDLGPPPIPKTYAGPQPTGLLGEFVVFGSLPEDDKRIRLGQTKAGVKVIAIEAPHFVKLGYQGGEFSVPLLPKSDPSVLAREGGSVRRANLGGSGASSSNAPSSISSGTNTPPRADGSAGNPNKTAPVGPAPANGNPNPANINAQTSVGTVNPTQPVTPAGGSPIDGASGALQPQRLPTPPQGSEDSAPEFVDRELLPPRLSEAEINGFTVDQARAALEAINSTDGWNVDNQNRARLNHERALLQARLSRG
ncbi:MAG: hypothetical protein RLZZ116_24 [Planctomycetota bacterium]